MKRIFPLIILVILSTVTTVAQDYPQRYFSLPLDLDLSLSATFGEVRSNHYHSGLDIRTNAEIGHEVFATAEGYVSRINISPWGGGKIVYIDHPNGYRTVYMHLNDFCGKIADWVRRYQYEHQCYSFDINIAPGLLPVYKGQLIAHSGNSGSSGGPHLHYEIRHANNDQTINAQLFGLYVPDGVAPTIKGIRIYPADNAALVNGKNEPLEIMVPAQRRTRRRKARPATILSPTVNGKFYIGIYATDHSETYDGNSGVYRIELRIDDELVYQFESETFLFEDTRSVNAIMDYPLYAETRHPYILTRTLPYAPITSSHPLKGNGIFRLEAGEHTLQYDVYDINGNHDSKTFTITTPAVQKGSAPKAQKTKPRKAQKLRNRYFEADIPAEALYTIDSVRGDLVSDGLLVIPTKADINSPIPPHVPYTLRLALSMVATKAYNNPRQVVVARRSGKRLIPLSSKQKDGWIEAHPRDFGTFLLTTDTIAPTIAPPKELTASPESYLTFNISDNLSGINTYNCYLNGRWILAEYDGKNAAIYIQLPRTDAPDNEPQLRQYDNILRIEVSDACDNTTTEEYNLGPNE